MTDNINIETEEIRAFMDQYRKYHPEVAEYSDAKIQYNLDRGWILGWCMARLAILSNAEPVARVSGYFGGQCVVVPVNPTVVLPVNAALFLHPSVPVPTDKNEKRLRYIYQQTMKQLVKSCMTFEEYIAALDVDVGLPLTNTGEQG